MTRRLSSFFKVRKGTKELPFGLRSDCRFNYFRSPDAEGRSLRDRGILKKQMNDSYELHLEVDEDYGVTIPELKLTNQGIVTWEDYWIDSESKVLVDPMIEHLNLQKNVIIHANLNVKRSALRTLILEGNVPMQALFVSNAPKLEHLNISNCPALKVVNLGFNGSLKTVLARNCALSSEVQEKLLGGMRPVLTSSSNSKEFTLFKKKYETLVDLRGTEIDWGNRRVASKIRLLLCNNWMVLWDNVPPASVVPPQMYSFFSRNLEEKLIKDYYGQKY